MLEVLDANRICFIGITISSQITFMFHVMLPAVFPPFLKKLYYSVTPVLFLLCFYYPYNVCINILHQQVSSSIYLPMFLLCLFLIIIVMHSVSWLEFLWNLSELNCLQDCPSYYYLEFLKCLSLNAEEKNVDQIFVVNLRSYSKLVEMSPLFLMGSGSNSQYLCYVPKI